MSSQMLCIILSALLLLQVTGQACSQQAKAVGVDTRPGDYFGQSVSISGDTVVAVAANEDGIAEDAGAAYVFIREGVEWRQQAKLVGNDTARMHHFGRSVCISGDTIVIGTRTFEGAAYVFHRAEATWGPLWSEQIKLEAQDKRGGDEFGRSVGVSGDVIVVGAPNGNAEIGNYAGAAYIFIYKGGKVWGQEAKIWGKDTRSGHYFGIVVAISGSTLVVGTSDTVLGAVYVFTRSGLTWSQQAKVFRSGAFGGDNFGASLSIYHNTLVVGAPTSDEGVNDAGAAYVFTRSGTAWSQEAKVVARDKGEGHRFGSTVSISGYTLAVAAQGLRDEAGNFGGSFYTFAQSGSNWTEQQKVAGKDTVFGDRFGASVSVSGNYVAVGAPREDQSGAGAGATYFLKCVTTTTSTTMTRIWTTPDYQMGGGPSPRTKAITSMALGRPWIARLPIVLSILAAWH